MILFHCFTYFSKKLIFVHTKNFSIFFASKSIIGWGVNNSGGVCILQKNHKRVGKFSKDCKGGALTISCQRVIHNKRNKKFKIEIREDWPLYTLQHNSEKTGNLERIFAIYICLDSRKIESMKLNSPGKHSLSS